MLATEYFSNLITEFSCKLPKSEIQDALLKRIREDGWGNLKPNIELVFIEIPFMCISASFKINGYSIINGSSETSLDVYLGENMVHYFNNTPVHLLTPDRMAAYVKGLLNQKNVNTNKFMPIFKFNGETRVISFDDLLIMDM